MKSKIGIMLLSLALLMGWSACNQQSSTPQSEPTTDHAVSGFFDQMLGTWKQQGQNVFEVWERSDTLFNGKVYQIRNNTKYTRETFSVDVRTDTVYYRVKVFNQNDGKPIDFMMTGWTNNSAVFENGDHDFPTRISYILHDSTHLEATTSGKIQGEYREIVFDYIRQ